VRSQRQPLAVVPYQITGAAKKLRLVDCPELRARAAKELRLYLKRRGAALRPASSRAAPKRAASRPCADKI